MMAPGGPYQSWAFRGQRNAKWAMWSSLSRHLTSFGIALPVWPEQEARILRIFNRKAHLYLRMVPAEEDDCRWLAVIQHYGGPTRLLDFTWSPYVAAFFALETTVDDSAVYAFDTRTVPKMPPVIVDGSPREFKGMGEVGAYRALFVEGITDVLSHADPAVLNQRITAQLGTFIVPGRLDQSVEDVIDRLCGKNALVKIVLPQAIRGEGMRSLMNRNVHNASLFPDLNGLAASLRYELEFHWAFDPMTGIDYPGYGSSRYAHSRDTSYLG